MDLLTPFRERIWHFFAPEKTATPTITKPTSPRTAPPLNADDTTAKPQARRLSLSPTVKRVKEKADEEYALSFDDKNEDESGDEEHSELSEEASDVEDEDTQEPKPKRLKRSKDYTADNSDFEPDDEEEETQADITQDEKDEFGIGITIEPVEHATLGDPEYEGWTQDELDLYNKLNDRGVVPLLHSSWKIDFPTIPEVLFTDDKEEAYIKAELGTEFRGERSGFSSLSNLTVLVTQRYPQAPKLSLSSCNPVCAYATAALSLAKIQPQYSPASSKATSLGLSKMSVSINDRLSLSSPSWLHRAQKLSRKPSRA